VEQSDPKCDIRSPDSVEYAQKRALKGGVLPAALDAACPTRGIDSAAIALRNTEAEILGVVRKIMRCRILIDGAGDDARLDRMNTYRRRDLRALSGSRWFYTKNSNVSSSKSS